MALPLPFKIADDHIQANFDALAQRFPFSRRDLQVEPAHAIGAAGEPAFQNAWVNFGAPWASASYWKDGFGIVHLAGVIKSGVIGSAALTLPAGYRPGTDLVFAVDSNNAYGRVNVTSAGVVTPTVGSNVSVSLSTVQFKQEL